MHLIRLLLAARTLLLRGTAWSSTSARIGDRLLAVKAGEIEWEEVERWRLACTRNSTRRSGQTVLPATPMSPGRRLAPIGPPEEHQ